jgi:hypothetical protein
MGIKPTELICCGAAKGQPQKRFIRIEDGKLGEKLFGFASGFGRAEKRAVAY